MPQASATPAQSLLTPNDHMLVMIDHQPQMAFATRSIDIGVLRNNAALVANAAREFRVATILTTVAEKSFSGPIFGEIRQAHEDAKIIDRTTMNAWEDQIFIETVNTLSKGKIVFSGLWTSVCIAGPALSAREQGFEVYVIADACGDVTDDAHKCAMQRMTQAGVRPLTAMTYLLELQRDWGRSATYDQTVRVAQRFGGGYGLGLIYAKSMFHAQEGH